jgi:hypothetical protein
VAQQVLRLACGRSLKFLRASVSGQHSRYGTDRQEGNFPQTAPFFAGNRPST